MTGGNFTTIDVPGAFATTAYGINTAGQIVGTYRFPDLVTHAFLLDGGGFTAINYPGSVFTDAGQINNAGQNVGAYVLGGEKGYVRNGLSFATIAVSGEVGAAASGIDNSGHVRGSFIGKPARLPGQPHSGAWRACPGCVRVVGADLLAVVDTDPTRRHLTRRVASLP